VHTSSACGSLACGSSVYGSSVRTEHTSSAARTERRFPVHTSWVRRSSVRTFPAHTGRSRTAATTCRSSACPHTPVACTGPTRTGREVSSRSSWVSGPLFKRSHSGIQAAARRAPGENTAPAVQPRPPTEADCRGHSSYRLPSRHPGQTGRVELSVGSEQPRRKLGHNGYDRTFSHDPRPNTRHNATDPAMPKKSRNRYRRYDRAAPGL
jgi:hypothetical protein